MSGANEPSPMLFFETANAFQRSAALKAAIELDLFTAIGQGYETAVEAGKQCKASERGIRMLCDHLTVQGFLTKAGDHYRLTRDSGLFLDRLSPEYVGGALRFLASPTLVEAFDGLADAVRKGGTVLANEGSTHPEHPMWVDFARGMAPLMAMPAEKMAHVVTVPNDRPFKILDIAAGHGLYGIAFAKLHSHCEVTAVDWANVLAVAQENAHAALVADRFKAVAGSAFDVDFGGGYDLVLLTNFLHHFDVPTCESLLRKVHAALAEGGRAVTLEFVPDESRITPPMAAMFSLTMLATTGSGDAYTYGELTKMFHNAGFARSECHPLPATPHTVVISYK